MQSEPNKIDWYEKLEHFRDTARPHDIGINLDGFTKFPLSEKTIVHVIHSKHRYYWTLELCQVEEFLKVVCK